MSKHQNFLLKELKNKSIFNDKKTHKASSAKEKRDKLLDDILDRMAERCKQKRLNKSFEAVGYTKANALMYAAAMDKMGGK